MLANDFWRILEIIFILNALGFNCSSEFIRQTFSFIDVERK